MNSSDEIPSNLAVSPSASPSNSSSKSIGTNATSNINPSSPSSNSIIKPIQQPTSPNQPSTPAIIKPLIDHLLIKEVIHKFYSEFNPDKLSSIDIITEKYLGNEIELLRDLKSKYNIESFEPFDSLIGMNVSNLPLPPSNNENSNSTIPQSDSESNLLRMESATAKLTALSIGVKDLSASIAGKFLSGVNTWKIQDVANSIAVSSTNIASVISSQTTSSTVPQALNQVDASTSQQVSNSKEESSTLIEDKIEDTNTLQEQIKNLKIEIEELEKKKELLSTEITTLSSEKLPKDNIPSIDKEDTNKDNTNSEIDNKNAINNSSKYNEFCIQIDEWKKKLILQDSSIKWKTNQDMLQDMIFTHQTLISFLDYLKRSREHTVIQEKIELIDSSWEELLTIFDTKFANYGSFEEQLLLAQSKIQALEEVILENAERLSNSEKKNLDLQNQINELSETLAIQELNKESFINVWKTKKIEFHNLIENKVVKSQEQLQEEKTLAMHQLEKISILQSQWEIRINQEAQQEIQRLRDELFQSRRQEGQREREVKYLQNQLIDASKQIAEYQLNVPK